MSMTREEIIDDLINNNEFSGWTDHDREMLEGLGDGALVRMHNMAAETAAAVMNAEDEDEDEEEEEESPRMKKARKTRHKPTRNAMDGDEDEDDEDDIGGQATQRIPFGKGKTSKGKGKITGLQSRVLRNMFEPVEAEVDLSDYIANAPKEFQPLIRNGVAYMEMQKTALVDLVDNHELNHFSREWLEQQDLEVLEGLATLAGCIQTKPTSNFAGAGSISPLRANNEIKEEALALPSMKWDSKN